MAKYVTIILLVALFVGLGLAISINIFQGDRNINTAAAGTNSGKTIKIGAIFPLTGDAASFGLIEQRAVELAAAEINNNGGVGGESFEVIFEDGKCNGADAVSAAQKLINVDHVTLMLTSCSSEALAVAPITERKKMILFASWTTSPLITTAGDYVFRNSYSDRDMARESADFILKRFKKIGLIFEQNDYTANLKDEIVKNIKARGGNVYEEGLADQSRDVRTP